MKKTFRLLGMALLVVVLCVSVSSCSKDDEDEDANVSNYVTGIVGTWAEYEEDGTLHYYWVFNSDGTGSYGDDEEKFYYGWETPTSFYIGNYWHCNVITLTKKLFVFHIKEEGKGPTLHRVK